MFCIRCKQSAIVVSLIPAAEGYICLDCARVDGDHMWLCACGEWQSLDGECPVCLETVESVVERI